MKDDAKTGAGHWGRGAAGKEGIMNAGKWVYQAAPPDPPVGMV